MPYFKAGTNFCLTAGCGKDLEGLSVGHKYCRECGDERFMRQKRNRHRRYIRRTTGREVLLEEVELVVETVFPYTTEEGFVVRNMADEIFHQRVCKEFN